MASLVPCVHLGIGLGCGLVGVGSLSARGVGVDDPGEGRALLVDAGFRIGVELPFARALFFCLHGDGLANLTRVTYDLDGQPVWAIPPLSASLGLAFRASL